MKIQKAIGLFLLALITMVSLKSFAMEVTAGQTVLVEDGESFRKAVVLSVGHGLARLSTSERTFTSLHRLHAYSPVKALRRKTWMDRLLAREGQLITVGQDVIAELEDQSQKVSAKVLELTEDGLALVSKSNGSYVPITRIVPVDVSLENKMAQGGSSDSARARF
jgi:hypothetical protein